MHTRATQGENLDHEALNTLSTSGLKRNTHHKNLFPVLGNSHWQIAIGRALAGLWKLEVSLSPWVFAVFADTYFTQY